MNETEATRLYDKLDEQGKEISLLTSTVHVISNRIEDLHSALKGNGKPGLIDDFHEHKEEDIKNRAADEKKFSDHEKTDFKIRLLFAVGLAYVSAGTGAKGVEALFELGRKILGV